jgi:hypothetical protein
MDYRTINPMGDVCQTDQGTKLKFADCISKAIFGAKAFDSKLLDGLEKQAVKYANTGHLRKLELCASLRKHAEKLGKTQAQQKRVIDRIMNSKKRLNELEGIEAENQVLEGIKSDKSRDIERKRGEVEATRAQNKLIEAEIVTLEDAVSQGVDRFEDKLKSRLTDLMSDFQAQSKLVENDILGLEQRKEEILQEMFSRNSDGYDGDTACSAGDGQARKQGLLAKLREKEKYFIDLREQIDSNNAKVSLQVRKARDELGNK